MAAGPIEPPRETKPGELATESPGQPADATLRCAIDGKPGARLPGGECAVRLRQVLALERREEGPDEAAEFLLRDRGGLFVAGRHERRTTTKRAVRVELNFAVTRYGADRRAEWSLLSKSRPRSAGIRQAALTPAGGLVVAGWFGGHLEFAGRALESPTWQASRDAFLVELDARGEPVWSRVIGGTGDQDVEAVASAADGSVFAAGTFFSSTDFGDGPLESPTFESLFLAKYTPDGELEWKRVLPMARNRGRSVNLKIVLHAGELILAGDFFETLDFGTRRLRHDKVLRGPLCIESGPDPGRRRPGRSTHRSKGVFLARFALDGKLILANDFPTEGAWLQHLSLTGDGDLLMAGVFQQRIDILGRSLRADPHPALACGCSMDCPLRQHEIFVARVRPSGTPLWVRRLKGWRALPLALDDGSLVIERKVSTATAPKHFGELLAENEYRLERVDADGNLLWVERSARPIGRPLAVDEKGRLLVGAWLEDRPSLLIFDATP